jgi:ATP-dependent helicase HepA
VAPVVLETAAREIGRMAISKSLGDVVVASAYSTVAVALADALESAFGSHRVARHLTIQSRNENVENVDRWREDESCRVLVCDESAEEGINLQTADVVMHVDLPWDVFRLEQRIGRADRFSLQSSGPVASMVFMYGEQDYALGWFLHAADACGVFERSVSSLQYVLADMELDLLARTVDGGPSILEADLLDRRQSLETEAQRITAHDSLDSVSGRHGSLNRRLIDEDDDRSLGSAIMSWLTGVGAKVRRPAAGTIEISSRPRPQVPFSLELAMAPWTGTEIALRRDAAVDRRLPILRPGHGLVDAIVNHLAADERGIAYAFLRPVQGCSPPVPVFRTDFMIRTSASDQLARAADECGLASWLALQRESLAPPTVETVYTSDVGSETINETATTPYDKSRGDRNLASRPDLFAELTAHLDWEAVCRHGLDSARALVDERDSLKHAPEQAASDLRAALEAEIATVRMRIAKGLEAGDERLAALQQLASAIPDRLSMIVEPIGCGATILADPTQGGS